MHSIAALFNHGDERADTIPSPPQARPIPDDSLRVGDRVRPETIDSIFSVLGQPEQQVFLDRNMPFERMGVFNTMTRQLRLQPRQTDRELETTIAHELAHQATTTDSIDPEIRGIMDTYISEFVEAPEEEQIQMFQRRGMPVDKEYLDVVEKWARSHPDLNELLAESFGEAYNITRQIDRRRLGMTKDEVDKFVERNPAGQEIINLFMRRYPQEP